MFSGIISFILSVSSLFLTKLSNFCSITFGASINGLSFLPWLVSLSSLLSSFPSSYSLSCANSLDWKGMQACLVPSTHLSIPVVRVTLLSLLAFLTWASNIWSWFFPWSSTNFQLFPDVIPAPGHSLYFYFFFPFSVAFSFSASSSVSWHSLFPSSTSFYSVISGATNGELTSGINSISSFCTNCWVKARPGGDRNPWLSCFLLSPPFSLSNTATFLCRVDNQIITA